MRSVSASDYYEVRKMGSVPTSSLSCLNDLYLPLVGPLGIAAYLSLLNDPSVKNANSVYEHGALLARLQMTSGQFEAAMKPLEAVGLVKTFYQQNEGGAYFVYCLYAPMLPEEFLSDVLFHGMLLTYIGEKETKALEEKYKVPALPKGLEECSESFVEFFHPDFSSSAFASKGPKKNRRSLNTGFDRNEFDATLGELGITVKRISAEEYDRIGKLGALYDLSSATLGQIAFDCYEGGRLNMTRFEGRCRDSLSFPYLKAGKGEKSRVNSSSALAQKIRMMDEMAPARFLSYLQGGHKPARGDLELIKELSLEIGLPSPCINALLDYVSMTHNGALVPTYCEKVAASMVREGCASSRDAMDYLTRNHKKKQTRFEEKPTFPKKEAPIETKEEEKGEEESLENLLAQL